MKPVPFWSWAAGAALKTQVARGWGRLWMPTVHWANVKASASAVLPTGPLSDLQNAKTGISVVGHSGRTPWTSVNRVIGRGRVLIYPQFIIFL